jgi:cytochrome c peroxidase
MYTCCKVVVSTGLLAASGCAATDDATHDAEQTSQIVEAQSLEDRVQGCTNDARVVAGLVSVDICVGADLFLRETFGGNGRSCATCHRVDNNFTIEKDFIATLPPDDPLFVAEFNSNLSNLEIPAQMRGRGLILENADGFLPDPRVRFVLRSVPHNLSMDTSVTRPGADPVDPPADRTGWSGDGAPGAGALRDFQNGAITQHYTRSLGRVVGTDFRLATGPELDRIDLFMRQLGRTNELALASVVMGDARAEAGRSRFLAVGCNACHNNAGANAGFGGGGNFNFNTGVEASRNPALASFPRDGGFLATPTNPDGSFGNGTFNTPPLVEAADTGPFFHTDVSVTGASAHNTATATTIEEAIAFYDTPAFNNSPSGRAAPIDLTATEIDDIGRFLRGVNATFNIAMALARLDAAARLVERFHSNKLAIQREMLRLTNAEIIDAIDVLAGMPNLNANALVNLRSARTMVDQARATSSDSERAATIRLARTQLIQAAPKIGSNLTYQIGTGTLMF